MRPSRKLKRKGSKKVSQTSSWQRDEIEEANTASASVTGEVKQDGGDGNTQVPGGLGQMIGAHYNVSFFASQRVPFGRKNLSASQQRVLHAFVWSDKEFGAVTISRVLSDKT